MTYLKLAVLASLLLITFSCKKATTGTFTNKITFGTSANYTDFSLTGEGTSFSVTPGNLVYRLESSEDFSGNSVKFVIKKDGIQYSNDISTNCTGHILITTKNYGLKGSYSVSGYIQKGSVDQIVASGTFQMN